MMRGQIRTVPEDLRLDFIRKQEIDEESDFSLPDIKKRHPRLYKNTRRDHDISDLDDPHIVELMRKGTIPPSLSLRAPPTHIGTSNHRNDVIGISKEEISKRYIIKLRKERARNNEAVYKSLDNLPIKIRQVAQGSLVKSAGTEKSSSSTVRSKLSNRSLPQSSTDRENKSLDPPWLKNNAMNPRKQRGKCRTLPRVDVNSAEKERSKESAEDLFSVSFEPNSFDSEMPYIFSAGFQGYQNRVRFSRKKPVVAFGKTVSSSANNDLSSRENKHNDHKNNNNHEFQRRYQRVLDSNQQPHFVKASLIKGQSVAHGYNKMKHILGVTENDHREELFAIKSVQRINQPTIFTSPASPTRVPNPSLYSEGQNSDLSGRINEGANTPDSRGGSSTIADVDSRENSYICDQDNDEKIENRDNKDPDQPEVPKLSLELLRVHENTTSAQTKKTHPACNLTDITERDESNLTKTTKSEIGPDMKISVRINYKSKVDAIEEHHSTMSASSAKSREILTPKSMRKSESPDSRQSNSTQNTLDNIIVQGRVYGEQQVEEKQNGKFNRGSVDKHKSVNSDEDNEMPMIIVDLKNLQTVKTPQTKKRKINKMANDSKEAHTTPTSLHKHTSDTCETARNEKAEEFFLTHEEPDSPLSNSGDTLVGSFKRGDNVFKKDATPRTEVDDSGISISTYENETMKC